VKLWLNNLNINLLQNKVVHLVSKSTQKQPNCEKVVQPLKAWVKKVGKSKLAVKNGCNDVDANKF